MYPWLEQLGIETVVTENLRYWDAKAEELIDWMRKKRQPLPDWQAAINDEFGIFDTLSELSFLTYRFIYFEQTKEQ